MKKLMLYLTLAVVFIIGAGILLFYFHSRKENLEPAFRKKAPLFTLKDYMDNFFNLSSKKGKVMLLFFWTPWSPLSQSQAFELSKIQKEYEKKNFEIIGVVLYETDPGKIRKALKIDDLPFNTLLGVETITKLYPETNVLPAVYLLDKNLRIYKIYNGYYPAEEFEEPIDLLLGE